MIVASDYRLIPLSGKLGAGHSAKVDADLYEILSRAHWCMTSNGYVHGYVNGLQVLMHRFVLKAVRGQLVDHKNRDKLDNRRSNLRFATVSQNGQNSLRGYGASFYTGVWLDRTGGWAVTIAVNGVSMGASGYRTEEEAAYVYDALARFYHGEFACTNFSGSESYSIEEARRSKWGKYFGVSLEKRTGRWRARVGVRETERHLGTFDTPLEAALARDKALSQMTPEQRGKALFNFPERR